MKIGTDIKKESSPTTKKWQQLGRKEKDEFLYKTNADCSFLVGSDENKLKTFECHKWILSSVSTVFERMLNGEFKESKSSYEIRLPNIEPNDFQKFLDCVYHEESVKFDYFSLSSLKSLIRFGRMYELNMLAENCIAAMQSKIKLAANPLPIPHYDGSGRKVVFGPKAFTFKTSATEEVKEENNDCRDDDGLIIIFEFAHEIEYPTLIQLSSEAIKRRGETVITSSYIHKLDPMCFLQLLKELRGATSEKNRFSLIETFIELNEVFKTERPNSTEVSRKNKTAKSQSDEAVESNASVETIGDIKRNSVLPKAFLDVMLANIDFYQMTAQEFVHGPGRSQLLNIEKKYDILAGLVTSEPKRRIRTHDMSTEEEDDY